MSERQFRTLTQVTITFPAEDNLADTVLRLIRTQKRGLKDPEKVLCQVAGPLTIAGLVYL
jgi:hypothetical protein